MRRFWALAAGMALFKVALHVAIIGRFDYHRDELYFIACGRHLAFGYVDHAPLVPWIAALAGLVFDHSLFGLRILPALAGGATVLLAAAVVRELGGGPRAAALAGLCVLAAPAYMRMSALLCIPVFEAPLWTLASLLSLRILRGRDEKLWLVVGAVVGVGLLNKHSMLLWIVGMGAGLAATRARRVFGTRWPWLGFGVALALFLPNLWWQASHEWATVEFLRNISSGVLARVPRSLFLLGQLLYMNPLAAPVWMAGLWAAMRSEATRPFGVSFLTMTLALLITHGKPYYLAPAYPVLFALGAVAIEAWARDRARRLASAALAAALALAGTALALHALPIFSVVTLDRITEVAFGGRVKPEDLSRELHDEYGWREQAAVIAEIHASLSPEEQEGALVLTGNYGEASAIAFFGRDGLPVASGHLTHHLWPPDAKRGRVVIAYGVGMKTLERLFADVEEVARIDHPLAISGERDLPVYLCRAPRLPLAEAWPSLRRYAN